MDDKNFGRRSAQNWIELIERNFETRRDKDIYPAINKWIADNSFTNILDLGAGQGAAADKINLEKSKYTGLEPSPYLLKRARENYPDHEFISGDAYNLPFEDGKFGGVFSIAVWHLLENVDRAFKELSRVLNQEGRFLIVTANAEKKEDWIKAYQSCDVIGAKLIGVNQLKNGEEEQDVLYLRSLDELKNSSIKFDLKIDAVEHFRVWTLIEGFKVGE